jgi:hypothetical protein
VLPIVGLCGLWCLGVLACDAKPSNTPAAERPTASVKSAASRGGDPDDGLASAQVAGSPASAPPEAAAPTATSAPALDGPASREPWPTRAVAGGATCSAGEAVVLGTNTQRRSSNVGPQPNLYTKEYSNVLLVEVGGGLLAAWPRGDDDVNVQPLDREGKPRGAATTVPLPGSAALYAFVAHGGGSPHALLLSHRRCKGNHRRCLASQWVDADGRAFGAGFDLELDRHYVDEQVIIAEPGGVLTASAYDTTIRGYLTRVCSYIEEPSEAKGCPQAMPSPKLHLYALDPAAPSAEPALLFDMKDRAEKDTPLPFVAGDLRGVLHFFVDREHKERAALRIVGKEAVPLKQIERGSAPLRILADPAAGVLSVLRIDTQAILWRYGLDGALREGPTTLDLMAGTPTPFAEHVIGDVESDGGAIVFRRRLARERVVGDPLELARPKAVGARLASMRSVVWTGERYVALFGESAGQGRWTIKAQAIACPGLGAAP